MTEFAVRRITPKDVPSVMELSKAAKWNQTAEDWKRLLRLSPENCRALEENGNVVATATLLPYGTRLAWIGMVLTHPEHRRRGLARRLMEETIAAADRDGIHTLMLDATDEGRPLYEKCGFVVEEAVERWESKGDDSVGSERPARGTSFEEVPLMDLLSLDACAFGTERGFLLQDLSASGKVATNANGYVFSREGREARYLGPGVSSSSDEAFRLIANHLQEWSISKSQDSQQKDWFWDLLPANVEARRFAEALGFTRRRVLWRMRRGEKIEKRYAMVYAIAGFELG